nr:atp-dependent bile acid permease [Quercus suber]
MSSSVIHGKTGSGKSLLLKAIIGEADVLCGEIRAPPSAPMVLRQSERATSKSWTIPSAFAYVDQVPWIENASVKSTILYGLPYHHARYQQVVHACALTDDLKMLPDGEETEIGATGINLSGGQRWRLTFARALYSRAGILVLDDIFSAVDAHIGRHLLQHGILGELGRSRTIIIATHHVALVEPFASYVVHLKQDGSMSHATTRSPEVFQSLTGPTNYASYESMNQHENPEEERHNAEALDTTTPRKFVEDETRQQGRVDWSVYATYITASGGWTYWLTIFLVFGLSAFTILARSYWLAVWTDVYTKYDQAPGSQYDLQASPARSLLFYLSIYVAISLLSLILVSIKAAVIIFASLRAARRLFKVMTARVLRARLRWLDTEPIGRILNRFVGDFALVDSRLGGDVTWAANGVIQLLTIVAAALYISAWMALPVLLLTTTSLYVTYLYLAGARDIKRLESNAKSPMFELVGSALAGLATIRAFKNSENYMSHMYRHVDRYAQTTWYVLLATQWMAFRQGVLGVLFTMSIASTVACMSEIDASLAGFALSFALDFSTVSEQTIRRYTDMELAMNSAERILEYHKVPIEPDSGTDISSSWPVDGRIEIVGLEVGYADDLDSVLKGIDVSIKPRERVGIVGRTGSGKSSLMLALFRFLDARRGSMEIDGIDIAKLKLHDLRDRLTIIPQDPVLFSGTLRSNLDPFDQHPDSRLIDALRRVSLLSSGAHIRGHSQNFFADLSSKVSRGGSNLSQGEKQLLCLARAILSSPKIIVLDEATSAVDMETDALIQRSIRKEFGESTLLVVAHRLSTVADFDKILVLSSGKVAEYDSPSVLAKHRAAFWRMLNDSGEKDALRHLLT